MWFIFVCNSGINVGIIWVNVSIMTTLIIDNFGFNICLVKLCIFIFFSLLMAIMVEPEKLSYATYYSLGVLMICAIIIICNGLTLIDEKWDKFDYGKYNQAALSYSGIYLGISGYLYESLPSVPNVRRMMKDRMKFKKIVIWVYICVGIMYFLTGFVSYLAYGPDNIKKHLFEYYYTSSNTIINKIQYIYLST